MGAVPGDSVGDMEDSVKIIDDLLKASNGYICGVETSKEYKALVKKLKEGNRAVKDNIRLRSEVGALLTEIDDLTEDNQKYEY